MKNIKGFDYIKTPEKWKEQAILAQNQGNRHYKFRLKTSIVLIAALLLTLSTFTIASNILDLTSIYKSFVKELSWTENRSSQLNQTQRTILENSGKIINKKITKGGVSLIIEGLLADRENLLVVYTIETEKNADDDIYRAFMGFKLLISDQNATLGKYSKSVVDDSNPNKYRYYCIYKMNQSPISKEAAIVVSNKTNLISEDIDIFNYDKKHEAKDQSDFEYIIKFPVDVVDNTREVHFSEDINIGGNNYTINTVSISPFSLTIIGDKDLNLNSDRLAIKLNDGTIIKEKFFLNGSYSESTTELNLGFVQLIDPSTVNSILVYKYDEAFEITLP